MSRSTSSGTVWPAHPTFPEIVRGSMGTLREPTTADELSNLIMTSVTPSLIANRLLPVLNALADCPLTGPARPVIRNPKADMILQLGDMDLSSVSDQVLTMHTLGFLYVLGARMARPPKSPKNLFETALRLCSVATASQLRLAPTRVTEFAWGVLSLGKKLKEANRVLGPLQMLLAATASGPNFNGVHAVFLEACLLTRNIPLGHQSLLRPVYINAYQGTHYFDVLAFHHHAGTIHAAVGDFERATDLFTFLACSKRAILCELLATGKVLRFPKYMSAAMQRTMEKNAPEYLHLARSFSNRSWISVRETAASPVFTAGGQLTAKDCNHGLVAQILESITKRRILALRNTYSRLTLADLAAKAGASDEAGIAQVKGAIERMVASGEIKVVLGEGPDEIVTFIDDDNDYDSPEAMARLKREQELAEWYTTDLANSSKQIDLSPEWLKKQVERIEGKERARGGEGGKGLRKDEYGSILNADEAGGGGGGGGGGPAVRGVAGNYADTGF